MGITEVITAPRSPRQNACVERVIGSIRRECLDHILIFNGSEAAPGHGVTARRRAQWLGCLVAQRSFQTGFVWCPRSRGYAQRSMLRFARNA
jgi:hypothetical protein